MSKTEQDLLAAFEAKVQKMRELGVTKWGEIELGPLPGPAPREETAKEMRARLDREQDARESVLFAATSTRPNFRRV